MESGNLEKELQIFREICIEGDSLEDWDTIQRNQYIFGDPPPQLTEPSTGYEEEEFVIWWKYLEERNKEHKIKWLNWNTFRDIQRPILIAFNHFSELCYYHTKYLYRLCDVSLKYGDRVEFILGDQLDMDLIYPRRNPIDFFSSIVRPEDEILSVFAIDERKRIYRHYDTENTVEILSELCEKLLHDKLFISQPIAERNLTLVKSCVHLNFDEMVEKSNKDVFLIVGLGDYEPCSRFEPNYEQIAQEFQKSNLDVVYINGKKNYVPLKYNNNSYPNLIFIPSEDKYNFMHFRGPRDTENVKNFILENLKKGKTWRSIQLWKLHTKPFTFPKDLKSLEDLRKHINEKFPKSLKVLDRSSFHTSKKHMLIHFMHINESLGKRDGSTAQMVNSITIDAIYRVAESKYDFGVEYLIADMADIDIIYPKWYKKYIPKVEENYKHIPLVFSIDPKKNIYQIPDFKSVRTIFYYAYRFYYSNFFHSQPLPTHNKTKLVKTCVARNIKRYIQHLKSDILLTIYRNSRVGSSDLLRSLDEIAKSVKEKRNMEFLKMDADWNYVPLEYSYTTYPVYFFIPHSNKEEGTVRYKSSLELNKYCYDRNIPERIRRNKEELLEFIQTKI